MFFYTISELTCISITSQINRKRKKTEKVKNTPWLSIVIAYAYINKQHEINVRL